MEKSNKKKGRIRKIKRHKNKMLNFFKKRINLKEAIVLLVQKENILGILWMKEKI